MPATIRVEERPRLGARDLPCGPSTRAEREGPHDEHERRRTESRGGARPDLAGAGLATHRLAIVRDDPLARKQPSPLAPAGLRTRGGSSPAAPRRERPDEQAENEERSPRLHRKRVAPA